jgi:hypothetical protein
MGDIELVEFRVGKDTGGAASGAAAGSGGEVR